MNLLLLLLLIFHVSSKKCRTMSYPIFKQCDSRWGSHKLGTSSNTICRAGCLMSSVAMSLNGRGKHIDGKSANPGTLNEWLTHHGGYVSGDLFVWGAVAHYGYHYLGQPTSHSEISDYVCESNHVVILNVHQGGHWVLATGVDDSGYKVNDPGFNTPHYSFSEVVRAGVFKVE